MKNKSFESRESSSLIIAGPVAAKLRKEYCENFLFSSWHRYLISVLGSFPQEIGRQVFSSFQAIFGLSPKGLEIFSIITLVKQRLGVYAQFVGKFPCINLGVALGGATPYLSTTVGDPFLPQAFIIMLKGDSPAGDINHLFNRYFKAALQIAEKKSGNNNNQHYDPIHDGWLTRYVNHHRLNLL